MNNKDDYNQNILNDLKLLLKQIENNNQKDDEVTLRDIINYIENNNINNKINLKITNTDFSILIGNNIEVYRDNTKFLISNNIESYDYILNNVFVNINDLPKFMKEDLEGIRLNQLILDRLKKNRKQNKIKKFVKKFGITIR